MSQLIIIGGGPRYTYNGKSAVGASSASFSFLSQNLGDAALDRLVVVAVEMFTSGTDFAVTAVTINGVTAAIVPGATRNESGGTLKLRTEFWQAVVPSGVSGNIDVTFAGSVSFAMVANYAMYGLASTIAAHVATDGGGSGDTLASLTIDVPAAGILLAAAAFVNSTDPQTLSGVTQDDSEILSTLHRQWGSRQASAPETGAAVSYSGTAPAGSARTLIAASWS